MERVGRTTSNGLLGYIESWKCLNSNCFSLWCVKRCVVHAKIRILLNDTSVFNNLKIKRINEIREGEGCLARIFQ